MDWRYGTPATAEQISKYINTFKKAPEDLIAVLSENNGGRPQHRYFDFDGTVDREFKRLLSIDESDSENVYLFFDDSEAVPFGISPSGDLFSLIEGKVYITEHETQGKKFIAESFSEFLDMLHE